MLNIVALLSLLYLLVGGVLAVRRRRASGNPVLTPTSVSREWLAQYQIHERPAHY